MNKTHYFDYAAATPVDQRVLDAMQPYWQEKFYNPSALYLSAKNVAKDISTARDLVAMTLGIRSSEVIFTAGGTESDNLALHGIMQQYPEAKLLVSAIEHDAVLEVAKQYDHEIIPVDKLGVVSPDRILSTIDDRTVLISVMHANNELGSIQMLNSITKHISNVRHQRVLSGNKMPLYLHTDASQTGNYLDLHPNRLGVDLMTINGGKIYGPKQTGMLFVSSGIVLKPQVLGGGQERGARSGTENVAGIIGFAKALEIAQSKRHAEAKRLSQLQSVFIDRVKEELPKAIVNSLASLPNFVHLTIPDVDGERLVMELDEAGIMCAVGSACSASNDEPSHVLTAIGLDETDIRSSVRFTMGRETTAESVDYVIKQLARLCK